MTRTIRPVRGMGILPLDDFCKEMDHLFQNILGENGRAPAGEFMPFLNVAETEGGYEVTADLPGVRPEEVAVEWHDGQLTLSGKRAADTEETGKKYHRVERRYGEFRRVVTLPAPIDEAKVVADFQHGVLRVVLPKSEKLKPTRIPVQSGAAPVEPTVSEG